MKDFFGEYIRYSPVFYELKNCPLCNKELYLGDHNKMCLSVHESKRYHFTVDNLGHCFMVFDSYGISLKSEYIDFDIDASITVYRSSDNSVLLPPQKTNLSIKDITPEFLKNFLLMV